MRKRNFTLVELLVVVGIIGILAALVIPAVAISKERGRITQARADMTSIRTAFEALSKDYGKMIQKVSSNYYLGAEDFGEAANGCVDIGKLNNSNEYNTLEEYCRAIAELADPSNTYFNTDARKSKLVNKRRIKYLDPRPEYDPSNAPDSTDNQKNTWLDPWGNPYMMRINVDGSESIVDPSKSSGRVSARLILWALGPDGKGDGTYNGNYNKDNVPGWKDGNWLD